MTTNITKLTINYNEIIINYISGDDPIPSSGSGKCIRDYVYIDDVINSFISIFSPFSKLDALAAKTDAIELIEFS